MEYAVFFHLTFPVHIKTFINHLLVKLMLVMPLVGILPAQAQLPTGFISTTVSSGWNEAVGLTFTADGKSMFV